MIGRPLDNGRYGGGQGGKEHRLHFPAVDEYRWNDAPKYGAIDRAPESGVSGQVLGAYVNTTDGSRGTIMGQTYNCCWPTNGFMS